MVLLRCSGLLNNRYLVFLYSKNHKNGNRIVRFNSTNVEKNVAEIQLSNGKKITLTAGKYARFATGNVTATCGDTTVMSTVVRQTVPTDDSAVPLTINYRQKAAAVGRIPTNFFRRELAYTEQEILTSRVIDRSVRPLFKGEYSYETQVTCNAIAVDGINDPDVLSINATSAVLSVSDIPWNGPVAAVRVGLIRDQYIINPSRRDLQQCMLNLIVTYTSQKRVVMIEGTGSDVPANVVKKAISVAVTDCETIISAIIDLQKSVGRCKAECPTTIKIPNDVTESVKEFSENELHNIFTCYTHDKISRDNAVQNLRNKMLNSMTRTDPEVTAAATKAFQKLSKEVFRSLIFETNRRCDGRKMNDLRPIICQVGLFKPLHGSAFFQRGQTQVLCTVTLDCIESALKMDTISMLTSGIKEKNFFLHYEFPPYATNETGRSTGVNRREIGHGALAEKGLRSVIPKDYPFAIRLTSEVLESNGSSSMASVCGGSLALLDAGVPISSPVAGIAMGLVTKCPDNDTTRIEDYRILTDLLGIEDYVGDMDFKMAGTSKGISVLQADMKIPGVSLKIIEEIINEGCAAKQQIIHIMNKVISSPNTGKSRNQPVMDSIEVPMYQRGKFLGVGGSNLKKIFAETGVHIYSQDDNVYSIFAPNQNAMEEAKEMIDQILTKNSMPELVFGDIYKAKITDIIDSGVLVILHPDMAPALLHISQLDRRKIHHPSALGLVVGQEIEVKYFGRDPASGQMRLSRKVLQEPVTSVRDFIFDKEKQQ